MLRLSSKLLSQNPTVPNIINSISRQYYLDEYKNFRTALSASPVIIADNIAQYYADCARQDWGLNAENYPCIAPPFKDTWFIEFNNPDYLIQPNGRIEEAEIRGLQCGHLFINLPISFAEQILLNYGGVKKDITPLLEKSRWVLVVESASTTPNGGVALYPWKQMLFIAENGSLLQNSFLSDCVPYNLVTKELMEFAAVGLHIPLLTLGFMHCKNIQSIDATEQENPPSKWCRRQHVPHLKYQVLQINPNQSKKYHISNDTVGDRRGKAFHICRGYFAHFIDDGISTGLFGRGIFGNFWVPSHSRGILNHGQVVSDYNIKSPSCED
jgi:hypothetical protein